MRFFRRKNIAKELQPKEPSPVEIMRSFRDIGETFNYMGILMTVVRHERYVHDYGPFPEFACDYVDKNGLLHNVVFDGREVAALIKKDQARD